MAIEAGTQFVGVSVDVDMAEKKSSLSNGKTEVYTIEEIAESARPYKVYTALLTQTGTDAPVATVLENTIGDIVWTRDGAGRYQGTLVGAFTRDKSICPPYSSNFNDVGSSSIFLPLSANGNPQLGWVNAYFAGTNNEDYLEIDTYDMSGGVEWSSIIGPGGNLPIEIRVYN